MARGIGVKATVTAVTTPSVPPEPITSWVGSMPRESLRTPASDPYTVASSSAATTSTPSTWWRIGPWRNTRDPPVLVATMPPRHGSAPRSIGRWRPWRSAAPLSSDSRVPASTVALASATSTVIGARSRSVDSTTQGWSDGATDAPTSPVLAPWGTRRTPAATA